MNQLNSLILEGRLVRDAVLLEPIEGFKICKFSIAVNRWHKTKDNESVEEVSFFDVEVYGKTAEFCQSRGFKGRDVRIVGRLKQDVWKDETGKKQSKVYVITEHIEYKPVFQKKAETPVTEKETGVSAEAKDETAVF